MRITSIITAFILLIAIAVQAQNVTGRVIGPDGKPVAAATVVIDPDYSATSFLTLKTDKQGSFAFSKGSASSRPDSAGRAVAYAPGLAVGGSPMKFGGNVIRLGEAGQAWGSVTDQAGEPVPGAIVGLEWLAGENPRDLVFILSPLKPKFSAQTTADGRWTIGGVPTSGKARVMLADPRFVRVQVDAPLGADAIASAALVARPGAVIAGRVVFVNGKPATNIRVFAQGLNAEVSWAETMTSPSGYYKLTGLSNGVYNVMVDDRSGKWTAAALEDVKAKEGELVRAPNLVVTSGAIIQGVVSDARTGKPIAGVSVGCYGPHRPRSSATIINSTTDSKGHYQLRVAPGRSYVYISGTPTGYIQQESGVDVAVGTGQKKNLPFKLTKGASVSGTAVDSEGKPVADVTVSVQLTSGPSCPESGCPAGLPAGSARTDAQGKFTITGLPSGKAELSTRSLGAPGSGWDVAEPTEISVPAPGPIRVVLRKLEMLTLTGKVVTPEGDSVPGATVTFDAYTELGGGYGSSTPHELSTDAQGRYTLPGLRPNVKIISLTARKAGYKKISGGEVSKNGGQFKASSIVLSPLSGKVGGTVTDKDGRRVAGARIASLEGDPEARAETDSAGQFTLESLPEGEVTVIAARGLAWGLSKAKTDDAPATITLAEPAPLPGSDIERGYAILEGIARDSSKDSYYARNFLPLELTPYDPELALKLAGQFDDRNPDMLAHVAAKWAEYDPASAAEWAVPKLDQIKDRHTFIYTATRLGIGLAESKPDIAADLYRRAKERAERETASTDRLYNFGALAVLADKLGNGEAQAMLDKALSALTGVQKSGFGALLAEIVARGGPALLDSVVCALPEKEQHEALDRAIQRISRDDARAALRLLDRIKLTNEDAERSYGRAAKYVIDAIGKSDPAKALEIARSVKDKSHRPMALALAAKYQSADAAAKLMREAADAAEIAPGWPADMSEIARIAMEVDPMLGAEMLARLRGSVAAKKSSASALAFLLRFVDPAESRLIIETSFAEMKRAGRSLNPGWSFVDPAMAMAGIDVDRALEMAKSIPEGEVNARFDALRKIAQYVLAQESVRRTIPFERWSASDTWIPGEPTGW